MKQTSDHYLIPLHTDIPLSPQLVSFKFRDFSLPNKDAFCNDLPDLVSQLNFDYNDPNLCTPHFLAWLSRLFDRYFPIKTKTVSFKRLKTPWITDELLICIKKSINSTYLTSEACYPSSFTLDTEI